MAFETPLQAHVVDSAVFVCTPDGGGDLWMTPEAVLESAEVLKRAAEEALRRRAGAD